MLIYIQVQQQRWLAFSSYCLWLVFLDLVMRNCLDYEVAEIFRQNQTSTLQRWGRPMKKSFNMVVWNAKSITAFWDNGALFHI